MILEKTLESPLDCNEIKPVNPKRNQSWIFIGRTDAEAESPVLWPPGVKSWLNRKDYDVGKDWRQEEKRTIEHQMAGWHHQLNGQEFEPAPGDGEGQGSLAFFSPWNHEESDMTERRNNSKSLMTVTSLFTDKAGNILVAQWWRICFQWRRHRFGKVPWRRKCQPTLVFLPGKSGLESMGSQRLSHNLATEQQNNKCVFLAQAF